MKNLAATLIVFLLSAGPVAGSAARLDFTLHKLQSGRAGNTLLVIGGIQGDEPGGFNAAALLVTHYDIHKGNVWVVPNLNFISIIKRSRGVYGDLNRKFASISGSDPEYEAIEKIKSIILDKQVDLILNLHDGSGFYRTEYIDKLRNPNRWGQSIIIDQARIACRPFGHLEDIAETVTARINGRLLDATHAFRVKNTRTREGNAEMAKTLTYFASRHLKPAFGLEASKSFPTHKRSYYHIQALESFMNLLGIEYRRKFELSESGTQNAIDKNVKLAFYDRKIFLDICNARNQLNYVPFKKNADIEFIPSNPLIAVVDAGKKYSVFHGNRRITHISPQYFEYDSSINAITLRVDGDNRVVNFGEMVTVGHAFMVVPRQGYRVNVIGFKKAGHLSESGISIGKKDVSEKFSIDKAGWIYRVEVYRQDKFTGMVLVNFNKDNENIFAVNTSGMPPMRLAQMLQKTPDEKPEKDDTGR